MQTDSSFTFVLFGGTGDLAMRKILPALYEAHRAGMLNASGKIFAVARHAGDLHEYIQWVEEHVKPHASKQAIDADTWASFLARIAFLNIDLSKQEEFTQLRDMIRACRHPCVLSGHRTFAVRADLPWVCVGGSERKRAHRSREAAWL